MATQIITIRPDGSMFGLDHKEKGLDLRRLGRVKTRRETLIELDEETQMWRIEWAVDGSFFAKGDKWDHGTLAHAGFLAKEIKGATCRGPRDGHIRFEHYRDAVNAEVAVIQSLQLKGIHVQ